MQILDFARAKIYFVAPYSSLTLAVTNTIRATAPNASDPVTLSKGALSFEPFVKCVIPITAMSYFIARSTNGHKWRTTPMRVAEGDGCQECGIGKRSAEEIRKIINAGTIWLLTHPDKPGFIKIGMEYASAEEAYQERQPDGWEAHRYRNVEDMVLAETLIWKLLGNPLPHDREPMEKDLSLAEEAFRELHYAAQAEMASEEKRKEISLKNQLNFWEVNYDVAPKV